MTWGDFFIQGYKKKRRSGVQNKNGDNNYEMPEYERKAGG